MNVNDAERVSGLLQSRGYVAVDDAGEADVIYVHTCAVRERAEEKLRSTLAEYAHLKRRRPNLRVGVGGCVAQLRGASFLKKVRGVDFLVGPRSIDRIPDLIETAREETLVRLDTPGMTSSFEGPETVVHTNPVRAYVTVMEGCNHVCSFCVVPRTRGPEVCRPAREVVAEARMLVARGFPEVFLLGQTINAYRDGAVDFASLLEEIAAISGLQRLRFTTSHPVHITRRLIDVIASAGAICPYLHLPFQSGSNRILESMRRGYTVEHYLDLVDGLRSACPQLALSSDAIVGYPSETEADFEATLRVLQQVRFDSLFFFAYSPRPGTVALGLPDDVSPSAKKRRMHALNLLQQGIQLEANRLRVGTIEQTLFEGWDSRSGLMGRTPQFKIVHAPGSREVVGRLADVEIAQAGANSLKGVVRSAH
jgi:tRNA-2-methylthio-N6-dimethylallyladenosine synthase